jgi:ABC-2 type transport system ATP-binding protein
MSTNENAVLTINGLTKNYKKLRAVNKLDLTVQKEMVFGLLGPNGSGKTTTLGMLLGVTKPSDGSFSWFNNGEKNENRKRIGALLETPNFYPYLTAEQNLELVATIKGLKGADANIEDVLKQVDLYERRDSKFKTFSLGMKQRLAIAATMLGDPEVLVLDEPTNGLDPQGIAEIRELIIRIGKQGKTIIIASHILDEVEKVCTHCAILRKGELLRIGTIGELIGNQDVTLVKVGTDQLDEMKKIVGSTEGFDVYKEEGSQLILSVTKGTPASDINKFFFEKGVTLNHLNVFNESLENQFLEIVNES